MLTTQLTLLDRLRTPGNDSAWTRFAELYAPLILHWTRQQGIRGEDAADVVQDVLTLLFAKLPHFEYDATKSFRGWLRTVVVNKCRERQRRPGLPTQDGADLDQIAAAPDSDRDREERRILVQRGLELIRCEFPASQWQAFWEYVINERSPTEVAAELQISVGSVYAAKSRVLSRLRLDLDPFLE